MPMYRREIQYNESYELDADKIRFYIYVLYTFKYKNYYISNNYISSCT